MGRPPSRKGAKVQHVRLPRKKNRLEPEVFDEQGSFVPVDPNNPLGQFSHTGQRIIKLKFKHRRLSQGEIAKILDLSHGNVNRHFDDARMASVLAWLDKDIYGQVDDLRQLALDNYKKILSDPTVDEWIKYHASRDILGPILQSKAALPAAPSIERLVFTDASQPTVPVEEVKGKVTDIDV